MFQPLKTAIPIPIDAYHIAQMKEEDFYLDGNPKFDRPLIVQFCANDPEYLLQAAKLVQPFCDAVDLNLGCPQGIARRGHYGAFLQEDRPLIYKLINALHRELDVPVTAKCRILDTKEETLDYVRMLYDAGASIVTVHGRRREAKGHSTGLAEWDVIRWLREQLRPERVLFANGNVLQFGDLERCLEVTGADAVMTAEGGLHDPGIFVNCEVETRGEYKGCADFERGVYRAVRAGPCGYRIDAVMRRYLDIIHRYVLNQELPKREPLFTVGDPGWKNVDGSIVYPDFDNLWNEEDEPTKKKVKRSKSDKKETDPNLCGMQAHLFSLLRPLLSIHTPIRDTLARCRAGDIDAFEHVLSMVEGATKEGIRDGWWNPENYTSIWDERDSVIWAVKDPRDGSLHPSSEYEKIKKELKDARVEEQPVWVKKEIVDDEESSVDAVKRCRRPWWVCQAYVRPLPKEALAKGSLTVGKKGKEKLEQVRMEAKKVEPLEERVEHAPREELVYG